MRYLTCLFLLVTSLTHAETQTVRLGTTKVTIIKREGIGKTLVHLHQNETTALRAAELFVEREGGTLITLQHPGERNIVFYLKNVRYEFDPNRIFTDKGIEKTLKQFGPYSSAAHCHVERFAAKIKKLLPPGKVIAVHNNKGYSIKDYFPRHPLHNDVAALFYLPETNYRNFYFVTKKWEFNRLKKLQFNVALQALKATDDGSLSYYLGQKNYINIESAYGALAEQIEMLYNS